MNECEKRLFFYSPELIEFHSHLAVNNNQTFDPTEFGTPMNVREKNSGIIFLGDICNFLNTEHTNWGKKLQYYIFKKE